jgi:hypothetical protein
METNEDLVTMRKYYTEEWLEIYRSGFRLY